MEKLTDAGSIPATSTRTPCDVITNVAGGVQVLTRVSSNYLGGRTLHYRRPRRSCYGTYHATRLCRSLRT